MGEVRGVRVVAQHFEIEAPKLGLVARLRQLDELANRPVGIGVVPLLRGRALPRYHLLVVTGQVDHQIGFTHCQCLGECGKFSRIDCRLARGDRIGADLRQSCRSQALAECCLRQASDRLWLSLCFVRRAANASAHPPARPRYSRVVRQCSGTVAPTHRAPCRRRFNPGACALRLVKLCGTNGLM